MRLPTAVPVIAAVWSGMYLIDQLTRLPDAGAEIGSYGSDGWHLREIRRDPSYLPPPPMGPPS